MKNSFIVEGARYSNQLLPLKNDIYLNGSSSYSNLKSLLLTKEISIPKINFISSGLISEIQSVWYVVQNNLSYSLHIFRYELNSYEILPDFTSKILFVKIFKPIKGIFNHKITYCLLVCTEIEIIIYGVENDTQSIVNTEFSCKLSSIPVCIEINNGSIFLGCSDGDVYSAIYKSIDLFNYKYLNLYSPGNSILKTLSSVFKRKKQKVSKMSVGSKYLVALTKNLEIYNIKSGIYKINEISIDNSSYIAIQIVEEDPLFFYCLLPNGHRDYFTSERIFSLPPPVVESLEAERLVFSTPSNLLTIRSSSDRSSFSFCSFNEDQLRNFSRTKAIENYEVHSIYQQVLDANLTENNLLMLTSNSVLHYTVLDSKKFLLNCRSQEIYLMYKNYGDVEFMIKYFQLLSDNEDISKLEGLCKNESIKTHALFVWIYTLIKPIWTIQLSKFKSYEELNSSELCLDDIVKKLKILKQRLPFGYETAKEFIDEFIQTSFYISILLDYSISFSESFESILTSDSDFKNSTLKSLLDLFTLNQSVDSLLKTMQNNCPLYLPIEQINLQRGLQLIKKDDLDSLMKSLEYLAKTKVDVGIINKFNDFGFYYGSIYLMKEKFDYSYENAVILFKESIKCKKALDIGLQDTRELFLYPFFEALLDLTAFSHCICCETTPSVVDIVSIDNPLFKIFLKDAQNRSLKACNIYWKYLLSRNLKIEAIEALISLSQRTDFPIEKKVDFLQTALSISTGTYLNSEIKLRLSLYDIQRELACRDPSFKSSTLLDSDTLFNDYCFDHADLKIKILDIIKYKDVAVIKGLFESYFNNLSLRDCILFLQELNNKNLNLVFDILANKIENSSMGFCEGLLQAGFEYDEIISTVKDRLISNMHPDLKIHLLRNLKSFSKFGEFTECENFCEKNYGIRIYK